MFRLLFTLLFVTFGSSCQFKLHRTLRPEDLSQCVPRQLEVKEWENSLALKFSIPGRNVSAVADKSPPTLGTSLAQRLTLAHEEPEKFANTWREGRPVRVMGPEVWQRIRTGMAEDLAPRNPAQGCLLVMETNEMIACRDAKGRARLIPLEARPRGLKLIRTLREAALLEVFLRAGGQWIPQGIEAPVMIITGRSPPLIYLHLAERKFVFLHGPVAEPYEFSLRNAEPKRTTFALRTATALFWSSSLATAINNPISFLVRGGNTAYSIVTKLTQWRPRLPAQAIRPLALNRSGMNLTEWEATLDRLTGRKASQASLQFLIDGGEFFPKYIQALQEARSAVDVRVYIFDNDDYGVKIADLLRQKASEGVRVRVMLDQLGTLMASQSDPWSPMPGHFKQPESMEDYLEKDSHIQLRPLANPWLSCSHTKSFLIDGQIGYVGGMNLGREYRFDWHDLMVEVRGPLVGQMQRDFDAHWSQHGPGGDLAWAWQKIFPKRQLTNSPPLPQNAVPVRSLYTKTFRHEIEQTQLAAIRNAQQRIWLENAYLTDHQIIRELLAARRRGVDVRIILPEKNDSGIIAASHLVTMADLLENGVRVYTYPGMTHVKAAVYDGWACLGSANFDRFSLQANAEFNIGFSDPRAVNDLVRRLFEVDFRRSKELRRLPEVPWSSYLADWLANEL
jgi:cardiolipin synthase A/B